MNPFHKTNYDKWGNEIKVGSYVESLLAYKDQKFVGIVISIGKFGNEETIEINYGNLKGFIAIPKWLKVISKEEFDKLKIEYMLDDL